MVDAVDLSTSGLLVIEEELVVTKPKDRVPGCTPFSTTNLVHVGVVELVLTGPLIVEQDGRSTSNGDGSDGVP